MDRKSFGAILKQIRMDEGLTLVETAFELYTSKQNIGNIESSRSVPKSDFLMKMLKLYKKKMIIETDDNALRCEIESVEGFSTSMKAIREHFGFSKHRFVDETGFSMKRIIRAENGDPVDIAYLFRISEIFPITIIFE